MLIATTKTDAINTMLSSIGYAPVNNIDDDTDVDVANAIRMLDHFSRDIQRKGWDYNTIKRTYNPDTLTKRIRWDETLISWKADDGNTYVKKDNYFYDTANDTFEFTQPITLTAIIAVDFSDLPDCFKNYITARASVSYQARYMGDTNLSNDLQTEAGEAWQDIVAYDMNMGSYNMLRLSGVSDTLTRS